MFVCLCNGVTDKQIQEAVTAGAQSIADIRKELSVATKCCKCLPEARAILNDALDQSFETQAAPMFYSA